MNPWVHFLVKNLGYAKLRFHVINIEGGQYKNLTKLMIPAWKIHVPN